MNKEFDSNKFLPPDMRPKKAPAEKQEKIVVEKKEDKEILNRIDRICAVIRMGQGRTGSIVFVGWNISGVPMSTTDKAMLSKNALLSYSSYARSGLGVLSFPQTNIEISNYAGSSKGIDYENGAEDLVSIETIDQRGNNQSIPVAEKALLEAIVRSEHCWQDLSQRYDTQGVQKADRFYTLFVPKSENSITLQAILFPLASYDSPNQILFKMFLVSSLSACLAMGKKKYKEIFEEVLPKENNGGLFVGLYTILFEARDGSRESLEREGKLVKKALIKKLFQVTDEEAEVIAGLRSGKIELEEMKIEDLIDLAKKMLAICKSY